MPEPEMEEINNRFQCGHGGDSKQLESFADIKNTGIPAKASLGKDTFFPQEISGQLSSLVLMLQIYLIKLSPVPLNS